MSQPTLVFVPGSWHRPTCYDKLIKLLEPDVRCAKVSIPSAGNDPNATFKDDIDSARTVIDAERKKGRNVIVIAHSYGGMVGSSVIKGLTKPKDAPENDESGYVIGLILIASGFNLTGMAFMDPFFGHPPPGWRVNNETKFAEIVTPPRELFYHDLPEEEANYWVSQLDNQSLKSLFEGGEHAYAGWQDVPSWYIGTVEDRGLPVFAQRMSVSMARSMGASVEHRELQTSHSPFLSQPEATAEIILEAVAAFTGSTRGPQESTSDAEQSTDKRIMFPDVRFMSPLSWFKFGIPVIFGRLLARGLILFGWGKRASRIGLH